MESRQQIDSTTSLTLPAGLCRHFWGIWLKVGQGLTLVRFLLLSM